VGVLHGSLASSSGLLLLGLVALLDVTEVSFTLSSADFWLLCTTGCDLVSRHSHDSTLELGGLTGPLAGNFIDLQLLVHTAPSLGPEQLSRLFALTEQGHALCGGECVWRAILADETLSVSRVDTELGERAGVSSV